MRGCALMVLHHPSLLAWPRKLKQRRSRCTLETSFRGHAVPSDTQRRESLDGVPVEWLRQVLPELCAKVRRVGWATDFTSPVPSGSHQGAYASAMLAGSAYVHATKVPCAGCVQRPEGHGQGHDPHTVVSATLVQAGSHRVMPWEGEEVRNSEGRDQQDGERNAAKRLISRVRQAPPQLPRMIGGDERDGHEPFIAQGRAGRLHHVWVCKPPSPLELYAWVEALERFGGGEQGQGHAGPACRRRFLTDRSARSVPLTAARCGGGTCVEGWEHDRWGQPLDHNAWCTAVEVTADHVAALARRGRSRWKIEHAPCHGQKNHGYELEPHSGHGPRPLARVLYLLQLLACIAHRIVERGDRLSQRWRATTSRRELWHGLRTARHMMLVTAWTDFLLISLDEAGPSPSRARSRPGPLWSGSLSSYES
jgi:hypothetical protein